MSKEFNQRVYGCAIVKAINSNYNADFSHRPRTLPDGTAYATDKAFKYLMRNYWVQQLTDDYVLYFKRLNVDMNPFDLDEAYTTKFGKIEKGTKKPDVLKNLLTCIDVRCFGATFANKKLEKGSGSISIHGPLQISHGVNQFPRNEIFSEQIMSPFRDDKGDKTSSASTLGTQHKLAEGHFVHHFSLNPGNLTAHHVLQNIDFQKVSDDDVQKIKDGMCRGASFYDSSAKAGIENELVLWVQLKEDAQIVLPSFVNMVKIDEERVIDLQAVADVLAQEHVSKALDKIEIYYDKAITSVKNLPANAVHKSLT